MFRIKAFLILLSIGLLLNPTKLLGGEGARPNVVLITVDTLRADHMDAYGHRRPTSPVLSQLARGGTIFSQAISQAPWTLPAMASIITGLYPSEHGAQSAESRLSQELLTLPEALRETGYHTAAVVSHTFVGSAYGFSQGFAHFDETAISGHDSVTSERLTLAALTHLWRQPRQPFFIWVHYFDPHYAYIHHPEIGFSKGYQGPLPPQVSAQVMHQTKDPSPQDLEHIRAVYDEEIAYTDKWIGSLVAGLTFLGLADSTVVIYTSDHGEYFMERGRFLHGRDTYQSLVRVPLVISTALPRDGGGAVVEAAVETRDLARTIAQLAQLPSRPFPGRDLLSLSDSGPRDGFALSEGSHAFGSDDRKQALVSRGHKLIHNLDPDSWELYDLVRDPDEKNDLWPTAKGQALGRDMRNLLIQLRADMKPGRSQDITLPQDQIEHLRSLGYTQ